MILQLLSNHKEAYTFAAAKQLYIEAVFVLNGPVKLCLRLLSLTADKFHFSDHFKAIHDIDEAVRANLVEWLVPELL